MADTRGISPVVGTMLLVGIVILLSVAVAALAFGVSEPAETAPTATLEMTAGDCQYELRHTAGDPMDGDRTELVGVEDPDALAGRTLSPAVSVRPASASGSSTPTSSVRFPSIGSPAVCRRSY